MFTRFVAIGIAFLGVEGCRSIPGFKSFSISKEPDGVHLFESIVRPVLEYRCIHCHNDNVTNGGLNLQDRDLVFRGNARGPFIVPGKPDHSRIWKAIVLPEKHDQVMPADGWGLTSEELRAFLNWIQQGAHWPEGKDGKLEIPNEVS